MLTILLILVAIGVLGGLALRTWKALRPEPKPKGWESEDEDPEIKTFEEFVEFFEGSEFTKESLKFIWDCRPTEFPITRSRVETLKQSQLPKAAMLNDMTKLMQTLNIYLGRDKDDFGK